MRSLPAEIAELFARWGDEHYGEDVSQLEHALQCASLARDSGADDALVVAALLHDIGHLLEMEGSAASNRHEVAGVAFLSRFFPESVTDPVALHVEAKRYLCAVEPSYEAALSDASRASLRLQGGAMAVGEAQAIAVRPDFGRAVALRRWDDTGKQIAPTGATLSVFDEHVARVMVAARRQSDG